MEHIIDVSSWSKAVGRLKVGGPISDNDRLENAIRICQTLMEDLKNQLTLYHDVFLRSVLRPTDVFLNRPCRLQVQIAHCCNNYRELEIASFSIVYQHYDAQLLTMCKPTVESVTRSLKLNQTTEEDIISLAMEISGAVPRTGTTSSVQDIYNTSATEEMFPTPKLTMGTALFELYLCLQQFQK